MTTGSTAEALGRAAAAPADTVVARGFAWIGANRARAFVLFLLAALTTRCSTFGDWNYEVDVQFYLLAGRRLLDGALLYVDLWDRKPPALFLLYAVLAALPQPMLAVQLAATAATALAAYGLHRIALPFAGAQGSVLAGLAYIVLVTGFGGMSGQAAVFYNPLLIACAWSVARSLPELARGVIAPRLLGGMACAGLAIACRQSAAIEGIGFGLIAVALAWRGGAPLPRLALRAMLLALTGAAPLLMSGGYYLAIGRFDALWHALVLSNSARVYDDAAGMLSRYTTMARLLAPIGLFAGLGLIAMRPCRSWPGGYALSVGWLILALAGLVGYPALFLHYALPLLAPLCLVGAPCFARRDLGLPAFALMAGASLIHSAAFDFAARARSRAASAELLAYVNQQAPSDRVLAWNFSPWQLALTGSRPPTPLQFAPHLFDGAEARSSPFDPERETRRVLAWQPEVVVLQEPLPARPLNAATVALVQAYVAHCRRARAFTLYDHLGPQPQRVYSLCAAPQSAGGAASGR